MPVDRLGGKIPPIELILLLILCLGLSPGALARTTSRHATTSTRSHKSKLLSAALAPAAASSHSIHRHKRHVRHQGLTAKDSGKSEPTKETIQPNYEAEVAPMSQIYRLRDLAINEDLGGDFGLAMKHFKEATALLSSFSGNHGPTDVLAFYAMGRTAEDAGQFETAKQSYIEALNHDSRFVDIHLRLASLLAKTGQTKQAISEAQKACDIDPTDPRGHFMLGLLFEHIGQLADAKQEKEKARNLLGAFPTKSKELQVQIKPSKENPNESQDMPDSDMPADMPEGLP